MNKSDEKRYTKDQVDLQLMAADLKQVKETVENMNHKLESGYVTKDELKVISLQMELLQRLVYGIVGLIITVVIGGMLTFYINAPK